LIIDLLVRKYPSLIYTGYKTVPDAHVGKSRIKAIVLGADPTHIVNGVPVEMKKVFGLDDLHSPYWRGIGRNLQRIDGLSMENIHVQNLCRNYFTIETSKNKHWVDIARDYWAPFLRKELDELYPGGVPVLITTEFILHAILKDEKKKIPASTIYKECMPIPKEENLLNRKIIAFYRHHYYSLEREQWSDYVKSIHVD